MSDLVKREDEWLRRYIAGDPVEDIARDEGLAPHQVGSYVQTALARRAAEEKQAQRQRGIERLNAICSAMMDAARAGDDKAAAIVVKATKVILDVTGGDTPDEEEISEMERKARAVALLRNPPPEIAEALREAGYSRNISVQVVSERKDDTGKTE